MLSVFALLSLALFAERRLEGGLSSFTGRAADAPGSPGEAEARAAGLEHAEIFPLAMFALLGMMVFATANDLLTLFVALEVLSLPLYVMCGLARRRRLLSQEAALKYFLLGAFSSAFFAYGIALAYGYAGGVRLADIDRAVATQTDGRALLLAAIGLMSVGLLFKIGAVPFHAWTPDVYQGAPTPVTAFMAAGTKAAAVVALMRVLFVAFGGASWDWRPLILAISVVTMLLGSLVAIAQTDVKRMLGYSSVAHAGFLLVGIAGAFAAAGRISSVSAILFYLAVYGVASIGAFGVVMLVRDSRGRGEPPRPLDRARPEGPGPRRCVRAVPPVLRWHPAHQRLRRQDGGLLHRVVRRLLAPCAHRGACQRRGRVLLRPRHRPDVLHRTGWRRPGRGGAESADYGCHWGSCDRDPRTGTRPGPGARVRPTCRTLRPLTDPR